MIDLMIRPLASHQISGIRQILSTNPAEGSLISGLGGTVWFDGCGCDFRLDDGSVLSVDIRLVSFSGETRLELIADGPDFYKVDILDDIVGDHVVTYNGQDFTVRVEEYGEEE